MLSLHTGFLKSWPPPAYMANFTRTVRLEEQVHGRNADNIYVIRPNTNWAKNSFHYRATLTWNSLDPTIKRETSLSYFLVCIKDLRGLFFTFDLFFLAIPVYVLYISDCICIYGSQEDQLS